MKRTITSLISSINKKTKKKYWSGSLSVLFLAVGFGTQAQVTIFSETMGNVGTTTTIAAHEAANGFDNDGYTMTGTGDVRNTLTSSGYSGASGGANIFLTNTVGRTFQIEGINTIGFTPMTLTFGINKSTTTGTGADLIAEVSTDGIVYTPLSYPALPTGSGTAVWHSRTVTSGIPATANLRIRFRTTGTSTQYRIDDVVLSSTACTPAAITASGPTTFCAGGSVTLTATSGASYLWSNGETTQSIVVTTSGSYSVTVNGTNICPGPSAAVSVTVNPIPSNAVTASGPLTFCDGGSVVLTASETGASYSWSNGSNSRSITVSSSGTFTVTVTENGCSNTSNPVAVVENPNPSPAITNSGSNILCSGETVTLSTGSFASYAWSNGATTQSISVGTSGGYSVSVTDANGCSGSSASLDIYVRDLPVVTAGSDVSICAGSSVGLNANGFATDLFISEYVEGTSNNKYIEIYNGTGASVNLSNYRLRNYSNGNNVPNFDNLLSGTLAHGATVVYKNSAAVTYGGAATAQTSVVFNGNDAVVLYKISSNQNIDIIGVIGDDPGTEWVSGVHMTQDVTLRRKSSITGGVTANPTGTGAGAFTTLAADWDVFATDNVSGLGSHTMTGNFTWSPAAGLSSTSGESVTASPSSTTTYTVSGAYACSNSDAVTVTVNSNPVVTATADAILCNGGSTTVVVSATDGAAPYSGTGSFTVTAGTYDYTVTDANGCSGSASITISEPAALTASASATAILCNGGSSTVTVSADGGTAPYSGTGSFNVGAGTYTYTVTDANGCTASTSISISEPAALTASASATAILCNGGSSTVTVSADGGTAPYSGTGSFSVGAGTYTYTVTDANGCTASTSVTISEPSAMAVSIAPVATSSLNTCAFGNGANVVIGYGSNTSANLNGSASGGTGSYTYSWSPAAGLSSTNTASTTFTPNLNSGCNVYNFTLTAMDANGCVASASTSVNVVNVLAAAVGNGPRKVSICHRTNGSNSAVVIEVSANAVAAHLAHGDCLGSCETSCGSSNKSLLAGNGKEAPVAHMEEEGHGFQVYPNPTSGEFTVELDHVDAAHAVELAVYDLTGKLIYAQSLNQGEEFIKSTISLNEQSTTFQNGLYMVQVINGDHQHYQKIQVIK